MHVQAAYDNAVFKRLSDSSTSINLCSTTKITHISNWDEFIKSKGIDASDAEKIGIYSKSATLAGNVTKYHNLLLDTHSIMDSYYKGELNEEDLKAKIRDYIKSFSGADAGVDSPFVKEQVQKAIANAYEYLQYANVHTAVKMNNDEAADFWVKNGVKDAGMDYYTKLKGTVYYNADYYYKSEDVKKTLRGILDGISEEYGTEQTDYDMVEKTTRFTIDGGLSYNGMWNFHTYQTNSVWMQMEGKRAVIGNDFVPPKDFIYAYTNEVSEENAKKIGKNLRKDTEDSQSEKTKNAGKHVRQKIAELRLDNTLMNWNTGKIFDIMKKNHWDFLRPSKYRYGASYSFLSYME